MSDTGADPAERLRAVEKAVADGHWVQAERDGAALYDESRQASEHRVAAATAMAVAKAAFNADHLDVSEQWARRCVDAAREGAAAALEAAGWVVLGAVHARGDRPQAAVAAVQEAMRLIDGAELSARERRTVHFGVDITYGALGLWRHAAMASRAAMEADQVPGAERSGLIVSRLGFVESTLRAVDDLRGIDEPEAGRLLAEVQQVEAAVEADEPAGQSGWLRYYSRLMRGAVAARTGRLASALLLLQSALADAPPIGPTAEATALLELAEAQAASGARRVARANARRACALLDVAEVAGAGRRPLPELQLVWRAERLAGRPVRALRLLEEYHRRVVRNTLALLDAHSASLTRRLSEQTLRLQNAELREANAGLARDVQSMSEAALTDALTGVLNRRGLQLACERWQAGAAALTVALVDLDHFKQINDRHSHLVGDAVLQRVGALLTEQLRDPDIVGRYGGEEFMLLLRASDAAAAGAIGQRLRRRVAQEDWSRLAKGLAVTISVGMAALRPGEPVTAAIARADTQLYAAKAAGRDRVEVAT